MGSISATPIDITNDDELQEILDACETATPSGPVKAKGEFTIDDLPPIEELTIIVPESECVELGKVSGIVGTLGNFLFVVSLYRAFFYETLNSFQKKINEKNKTLLFLHRLRSASGIIAQFCCS